MLAPPCPPLDDRRRRASCYAAPNMAKPTLVVESVGRWILFHPISEGIFGWCDIMTQVSLSGQEATITLVQRKNWKKVKRGCQPQEGEVTLRGEAEEKGGLSLSSQSTPRPEEQVKHLEQKFLSREGRAHRQGEEAMLWLRSRMEEAKIRNPTDQLTSLRWLTKWFDLPQKSQWFFQGR